MITKEIFEDYLFKSGDTSEAVYPGKIFETDLDDGFCIMDIINDVLFVHQCYGNGDKWNERIEEIGKRNNCTSIQFLTKRSPRAFERKWGYTVEGYLMTKSLEEV